MKSFLLITACLLGFSIAFSQSTAPVILSSSGDYFIVDDYSLSWTLGESISETFSFDDYILTQGFQQSGYIVTSASKTSKVDYKIHVYPNPVTDFIIIDIESEKATLFKVEVSDVLGKKLLLKKIPSNVSHVNLNSFKVGYYFLKILDENNKEIKTYKVVKNY